MALCQLFIFALVVTAAGSLDVGFYDKTCPHLEIVVRKVVQKWFLKDKSAPAGLLRLHFHDCFIRGCDASVLIDSTEDNIAEKDSVPNLTLRGFDLIDDIKTSVEATCNGVVSCADILTLAARDAVALSGGPDYSVPTGRRDGLVSRIGEAKLPSPQFSIDQALGAFTAVGLNLIDLVTLLGAHTIGFVHCGFFSDRVYDFRGSGMPDPAMNSTLATLLKAKCPPPNQIKNISLDPKVFFDQTKRNPFTFSSGFYRQVLKNRGVLQIDQELLNTDVTSNLVVEYAANPDFFKAEFAKSITKLGSLSVLTGVDGEIRTNCRKFNMNANGN
ncbi:hypothetical protein SUGI_0610570 [Cryptomeria japonica]|uniref:peroxidase 57 n=1 Tax=Cryptomeria japonica TaxID=3369 RepID=UPI002414C4A9|nr:peroxidase 57 [Cryptomeria japonica]GLJ30779.1 hypothetical protein SUGI_0610570 [Cryptomeria japonica]